MHGGDANETASAGESTATIITRDLLGGSTCTHESKELDLDLKAPSGLEKNLKSGKVHLQRCNSSNSSSSTSEHKPQVTKSMGKFQDLNHPPRQTLNLFDETVKAELKLVAVSPSLNYQNVCTLDKVKSALERAEKVSEKKRSVSIMSMSSSSPLSNSSSSVKDGDHLQPNEKSSTSGSFAAGCPCCLMYVLISVSNPTCPRCNSNVPPPAVAKKPRIDCWN